MTIPIILLQGPSCRRYEFYSQATKEVTINLLSGWIHCSLPFRPFALSLSRLEMVTEIQLRDLRERCQHPRRGERYLQPPDT